MIKTSNNSLIHKIVKKYDIPEDRYKTIGLSFANGCIIINKGEYLHFHRKIVYQNKDKLKTVETLKEIEDLLMRSEVLSKRIRLKKIKKLK